MTSSLPTVTVVTVVFNGAHDIARTMESVIEQSYPDLEFVVVDGASSDGTQDIVRSYAGRVAVFVSESDAGIYNAMNKAIGLATGDYLVFMNCGDVFAAPDALATAMRAATSVTEEVIFGAWLRDEAIRVRLCQPSLAAGLFNHQAIVYSRSIHRWHGDYVDVPGLTTADYLFFATLIGARTTVRLTTIDTPIARINVAGVSSGLQTFSQKNAIDYMCGRKARVDLLLAIALHPAYSRVKGWLRRLL